MVLVSLIRRKIAAIHTDSVHVGSYTVKEGKPLRHTCRLAAQPSVAACVNGTNGSAFLAVHANGVGDVGNAFTLCRDLVGVKGHTGCRTPIRRADVVQSGITIVRIVCRVPPLILRLCLPINAHLRIRIGSINVSREIAKQHVKAEGVLSCPALSDPIVLVSDGVEHGGRLHGKACKVTEAVRQLNTDQRGGVTLLEGCLRNVVSHTAARTLHPSQIIVRRPKNSVILALFVLPNAGHHIYGAVLTKGGVQCRQTVAHVKRIVIRTHGRGRIGFRNRRNRNTHHEHRKHERKSENFPFHIRIPLFFLFY